MFELELPISEPPEEDEKLRTLLGEARAGSAPAFEQLAARVRARVARWAGALASDPDDAEDVAQLVLLRLHARLDQFDGRSRFTSWLYRLTRNVAFSRRRMDLRRARLLEGSARDELVREEPGPEAASDAGHLAELIRTYHEGLTGRQRLVFEMADLRGLTTVEIAGQLGVKPVTVRVALFKARRAIRLRMLAAHPRLLEEYEP